MKGTSEKLSLPLQYVKGVGPQRAETLARLNLLTVRDVLFYFPRAYEDLSTMCDIDDLKTGQKGTVCGKVEEIELRELGSSRSILGVLISQDGKYLRGVWFNQPFMQNRFARGQTVLLSGLVRLRGGRWQMAHPKVTVCAPDEEPSAISLLPAYSLTQGIAQPYLRRICQRVVTDFAEEVDEVFPLDYLEQHNLLPIARALQQIHGPENEQELARARRRFVYQELLILQLALALRRRHFTELQAPVLPLTAQIRARIERLLPFALTADQQRAVEEIGADLGRPFPMNRLLQGDVGSGKTVVAMFAMLQAVAHGHQAALMAPTELLAHQHAETLRRHLGHSRVTIGLLTGGMPRAERETLLEAVGRGETEMLVGTQAIANAVESEAVRFARLGIMVIDEQHKFGVRQRAQLKQAGLEAHYLVMTATPIPRTIAMGLFGDLDVSSLRESPPGRQVVHTYLSDESKRDEWWDFFRRKLREGRQGFVISPLVEDAATTDVASAERAFEELACNRLEEFRVGLVHGRMKNELKEAALHRFASGESQVLVATSVVEVGIDVPNATLMTIESAERFGLAQLHQLRGRVSRGTFPGYVCAFANSSSEESKTRLEAFCNSNDGFALSEIDFQLRGPGDLFGVRQHGLPPLRIADLQRDQETLEEARRDAQAMIANDPELAKPELARLRRMVLVRYGKALELSDVG